MNVEDFLRNPEDFTLRIGEHSYSVRNLHEAGDNPAFASFLLQTRSDSPQSLVGKIVVWDNSSSVAGTDPQRVKKQVDQLEKNKRQIERKREDAQSLVRLAAESKAVPVIFHEAVICISKSKEECSVGEHIILREFINGLILSKWMKAYEDVQPQPAKAFVGIREPEVWFKLARKLVKALIPIHNERLVHGDLRPRSIILEGLRVESTHGMETKESKAQGLDISRARVRLLDTEEDGPDWFPPVGIDDTGTFRRKYDSPKRLFEKTEHQGKFVARKSNAQWFAPTDIFSLGIILFSLACGNEAQLGPFLSDELVKQSDIVGVDCPTWFKIGSYEATKTNRQLKAALLDSWEKTLGSRLGLEESKITKEQWTKGKEAILRMSEVILACLRSHTDASVADLKAIEAIIDEFDPALKPNPLLGTTRRQPNKDCSPPETPTSLENALKRFMENQTVALPDAVKQLILRRGRRLIGPLSDLTENRKHWSFRVTGRPSMVDTMVNLISQLEPRDTCRALLTANFFSKENMGLIGRVTTSLQLAAISGVQLEWLILVNEEQLNSRAVGEILQVQRTAAQFLKGLEQTLVKPYGLHYVVVNAFEYGKKVLQSRLTSILITTRGREETNILIAPDYHGEDGQISALRIWATPDPYRWEELNSAFEHYQGLKRGLAGFHR